MKGFDLLKAVTDLVTALLLKAQVSHAGNCLAMSNVVRDFLVMFEIDTKLINVKVDENGQKINHYCLEMEDGKIIDPTASQFKGMPKIFIGKIPLNYLDKKYVVICRCGAIIPNSEVDNNNGTNEEGEEYGTVEAQCNVCNAEYETSQWGHWDNKDDAVRYLNNYINDL